MSLTQEQADRRALGVGGSEAAAVCGISPWATPVQVWQQKRGLVPPPDLSKIEYVQWGELLEEVIGKEWGRRQNQIGHRVRETKVSKQHEFMVANIDFRVVGKREGLEVKNTSQWTSEAWGELGSDDVPLYYLMQGVHYMHVLDYDAWNYAVLMGGNELLHYRVTRDADVEKRLITHEAKFWDCVQSGTPPPAMRVDDLTRLWAKTHGRKEATPEIAELVARAKEIKALIKPLDSDSDKTPGELQRIKLEVGAFMGEAGDLFDPTDPTILIATYRANDEVRVDTKRVREGHLKKQIVDAITAAGQLALNRERRANGGSVPTTSHDTAIAMLDQLGAERFADLICGSLLKTGVVRKFLPK